MDYRSRGADPSIAFLKIQQLRILLAKVLSLKK